MHITQLAFSSWVVHRYPPCPLMSLKLQLLSRKWLRHQPLEFRAYILREILCITQFSCKVSKIGGLRRAPAHISNKIFILVNTASYSPALHIVTPHDHSVYKEVKPCLIQPPYRFIFPQRTFFHLTLSFSCLPPLTRSSIRAGTLFFSWLYL